MLTGQVPPSAICKPETQENTWCNSSLCVIQSESKVLRTKGANGVNLDPKAKEDPCSSSSNQAERTNSTPATHCSIQALKGLNDLYLP